MLKVLEFEWSCFRSKDICFNTKELSKSADCEVHKLHIMAKATFELWNLKTCWMLMNEYEERSEIQM